MRNWKLKKSKLIIAASSIFMGFGFFSTVALPPQNIQIETSQNTRSVDWLDFSLIEKGDNKYYYPDFMNWFPQFNNEYYNIALWSLIFFNLIELIWFIVFLSTCSSRKEKKLREIVNIVKYVTGDKSIEEEALKKLSKLSKNELRKLIKALEANNMDVIRELIYDLNSKVKEDNQLTNEEIEELTAVTGFVEQPMTTEFKAPPETTTSNADNEKLTALEKEIKEMKELTTELKLSLQEKSDVEDNLKSKLRELEGKLEDGDFTALNESNDYLSSWDEKESNVTNEFDNQNEYSGPYDENYDDGYDQDIHSDQMGADYTEPADDYYDNLYGDGEYDDDIYDDEFSEQPYVGGYDDEFNEEYYDESNDLENQIQEATTEMNFDDVIPTTEYDAVIDQLNKADLEDDAQIEKLEAKIAGLEAEALIKKSIVEESMDKIDLLRQEAEIVRKRKLEQEKTRELKKIELLRMKLDKIEAKPIYDESNILDEYRQFTRQELANMAKDMKIMNYDTLNKHSLAVAISTAKQIKEAEKEERRKKAAKKREAAKKARAKKTTTKKTTTTKK